MTAIESELLELAGIRSEEDPVVTLYLNTRWSDHHQRERVRLFVRHRMARARARAPADFGEAFERTLRRVEEHVEGLVRQAFDESAHGVAIFACEGLGLWRTFELKHEIENEFGVGPTPQLLRLARFVFDYQPAVVAVVDARGAWIFETALGDVIAEARIEHQVPARQSMGGWSQFRYQRHVDQLVERNHEEAAKTVTFLLEKDPKSQLILVGTSREVAAFERALPAWIRPRILAKMPAPGPRRDRKGEIREHVLASAVEEVLEHERALEKSGAHAVVGEALAGGLAELGPEDVVLAANQGRVHRLLLEDGFDQAGWRCTNCDAFGIKTAKACRYCGGPTEVVALGEELARRVIQEGGEVEVYEPQPLLDHYFGVAAVLRHRGARAEIGAASEPLAY